MADRYIYSTLSSDVVYTDTINGANDMPKITQKVLVKGGAGIASKHLVTPRGVVTKVTEQELETLEKNPVFKLHQENGYITIEAKKHEVEVVVADMVGRDNSAPMVPEDFNEEEAKVLTETKPKAKRGRPSKK